MSWGLLGAALALGGCGGHVASESSGGGGGGGGTTTSTVCTPGDNANPCWTDLCNAAGVLVSVPTAAGTPCAKGACDGQGTCVAPACAGTVALPGRPAATVPGADHVKTGDFNGDGHLDLALTGLFEYDGPTLGVGIALGSGHGTFVDNPLLADNMSVSDLAVADFDGDGNDDLATAGCQLGLQIFRGHGDGTFDAPLAIDAGTDACFLATADFDGDGDTDFAVRASWELRTLLNQGGMTFALSATYPMSDNWPTIAADFDGDGVVDLAGLNSTFATHVNVLRNDGTGTFSYLDDVLVEEGVSSLVATDLNGDGALDLALTMRPGAALAVEWNLGDGTFYGEALTYTFGDLGALAVADVEGDGSMDLVAAEPDGHVLHVFRQNEGLGMLERPGVRVGPNLRALAAGDFDEDGQTDVAAASNSSVAILVSRGTQGLIGPLVKDDVSADSAAFAIADWDGDDLGDVVFANAITGVVTVAYGAHLAEEGIATVSAQIPDGATEIVAMDRARKGAPALAALGTAPPVFVTAGHSEFGGLVDAVSVPIQSAARKLVAFDMDGDLLVDFVVGNSDDGSVQVVHNLGDGAFEFAFACATNMPIRVMAVGDVNGDGLGDVVGGEYASSSLYVLLGQEGGGCAEGDGVTLGSWPLSQGLALADVDGDNALDLISAEDGAVEVWRGAGDGSFTPLGSFAVPERDAAALAIADMNTDGKPDLVVTGQLAAVFLNQGDGAFALVGSFPTGSDGGAVAVGDLDGDGRPDVVTTAWDGHWLASVLRNRCED